MNVIVYSAVWCMPCKMLHQVLRREGIKYSLVDIDDSADKAHAARVRSVPTTIVLDDEGTEVLRVVGAGSGEIKRIKAVLASGGT